MQARKGIGITVLVLLSVFIFFAAALPYAFRSVAEITAVGSVFEDRFQSTIGVNWLYAHIIGSSVALLLGPLQFIKRVRVGYPAVHRWIGRAYLFIGIFIGGVAGLAIAPGTIAGSIGAVGFAALAILWLATGAMALVTIRNGRVQDHRRWMIRNYALTFGAVTLRLWLGMLMALGSIFLLDPVYAGDSQALFVDVYRVVAWLAWVPNLLLAEWLFIRRPRARRHAAAAPQLTSESDTASVVQS